MPKSHELVHLSLPWANFDAFMGRHLSANRGYETIHLHFRLKLSSPRLNYLRSQYPIWYEPEQNQQNDVCPAKTQISLGIHPVGSASMLSAWRKSGSFATIKRTAKTDQTRWSESLLGTQVILLVLSCCSSTIKHSAKWEMVRNWWSTFTELHQFWRGCHNLQHQHRISFLL